LPSDISHVPDTFGKEQKQRTKHVAFPARICCYFDELALQKQTPRRPKEEKGYRSEEIFLQNTVAEEETVRS
jgi:hypothetical protein